MKAVSSDINFPAMERELLDLWEKNQSFYKSNERRKNAKEFSFYDGPPFANGLPHYGHILGQTIKDIVPRYWNMRGFYVERRFGWDCHGLPVEYEVEKKLNLVGRKSILELGVAEFNEECRKTVFHYANEWRRTVTRIGRWVDWNNQYRTMDVSYMESVWWVFKKLHEKGLVYQDRKIVAYSPRITAVVSNFEANQNYKDVQDPSVTVKFKLKDENSFLIAWTTTPWTLISNLALAVNPELTYLKTKDLQSGEHYYFAKDRLDFIYKPSADKMHSYEIVSEISGKKLVGRSYEPLFSYFADHPNAFKVLAADFVSMESGSGIVHCAPAFGEDDFSVCKKNQISLVDPLDEEAKFTSQIPEYQGQYVKDADKLIIKDLKQKGHLLKHDTIVHSYPHCDRTEDPLIYRAIPTWYVAVEKIKEQLVNNNQKVHWVPEHLRDGRMGKWLENARDWAISRNRFWGTPIPIWISDQDPNVIEVVGSIDELEKKSGVKVKDLHKHFIDDLSWSCAKTGGIMRRIPEVFDCWFESGSMPYAQNHFPFENEKKLETSFPADFIAEGQDQTRGWFYTLMILSTALFNKPAFKNVIVNGIVLASDGKKMSKRLQNYTPPDVLLDKFGADSVRLYMLNSSVLRGEDLKFSDEGVRDITRAVLLPLWNAYSFLTTYADADQWTPSAQAAQGHIEQPSQNEMDRWIISRLQSLKTNVHAQMQVYKLYNVVPQILGFIEELTNWYIRLNRRRFWSSSEAGISKESRSAYESLYHVILELTKVFAPFAPFISEQIYLGLTDGLSTRAQSIHLVDMPEAKPELIDHPLEEQMEILRRVTGLGRSLRAKHQIKTRQVLPQILVITRNKDDRKHIEQGASLIREELNLKEVLFSNDEAHYVKLSVKPNLKTLGRRLGKELSAVRSHLEALSSSHENVAQLLVEIETKGSINILGHELGLEDFLIERGPKDHRLIATEAGVTVLLDTTLNQQLVFEGLSREVINRVQKLRKDSGLNVSDRISLTVVAEGELVDALNQFSSYVSGETLATQFIIHPLGQKLSGLAHTGEFDIDGLKCTIGLSVESTS